MLLKEPEKGGGVRGGSNGGGGFPIWTLAFLFFVLLGPFPISLLIFGWIFPIGALLLSWPISFIGTNLHRTFPKGPTTQSGAFPKEVVWRPPRLLSNQERDSQAMNLWGARTGSTSWRKIS